MTRERPCRYDCNRPGCGPTKCLGRIEYDRDDPRHWVGKGLMPVAGKPFGWAHAMERQALREHLIKRGRYSSLQLHFAIIKMQHRLHREWPARWAAIKGARRVVTVAAPLAFSRDELQHLADLFDGANDPTSAAIGAKARAMLT